MGQIRSQGSLGVGRPSGVSNPRQFNQLMPNPFVRKS